MTLLEPHSARQAGQWRDAGEDNRLFTHAVFWILRTGSPQRKLAAILWEVGSVHQRFRRRMDKGIKVVVTDKM